MLAAGIGYAGFFGYAIPLWLITGLLILRIDVKGYELAAMDKERKASRFVGWLNIVLGILTFIANWSLNKWGW
ncbi:MAG: hypothetical protein K0Q59_6116 [Paenibacillus sp.]|jgi:uncharacterized membrane protein|nr:hypothetical protein [Paenibacillus sp.]